MGQQKTIIVTVLNQDRTILEGNFRPNYKNTIEKEVQAKINRINNLNIELKKQEYTNDEINKINFNNLFDNLNNWTPIPL